MLQAPYNQVTVVVVSPAAGYAADIFELVDNGNNNGVIRVKNENLLQNDDSEEYVVSKSELVYVMYLGFSSFFSFKVLQSGDIIIYVAVVE